MQIARVTGPVVAVHKHPSYEGLKLLLAQPLTAALEDSGDPVVAVDLMDAGTDDLVLITSEGQWARARFGDRAPIRSVIVAVLEGVEYDAPDEWSGPE
jgi:microcompartment protein CcmK/EutM